MGPTGARPVGDAPAALQTWISRKLSGVPTWTLDDLDRFSAHYGIPVPDLVAGVDRGRWRRRGGRSCLRRWR
ncbi:hypothetical protein ACTFBT_38405 [Streptomyces microflavus]|uniref:hypothetical protein n=1 Tax=Streptomyces TaxID=1883 RepID=UPI00167D7086|nr:MULTISPECIES: hypothetical protein [Streptomyces]MDX2981650.1 hypothetical protein [Streptomyces sp. NRRL_B-2249]